MSASITLWRQVRRTLSGVVLLLGSVSGALRAQSTGGLAAWNALVVSPVGALPPGTRDALIADSVRTEISLRYGRWSYDADDAIHNNVGVTVGRHFGFAHTTLSGTLAYLSVACGACAAWLSGGIEAQMRLGETTIAGGGPRAVRASVGVRATVGGARYLGPGGATASSIAGAATVGIQFPTIWSSWILVSIMPGVGAGRFASVDETAFGVRPIVGAAFAWALRRGLILDLGLQRIYLDGGPTQFGAGLSWRLQ